MQKSKCKVQKQGFTARLTLDPAWHKRLLNPGFFFNFAFGFCLLTFEFSLSSPSPLFPADLTL